VAFTAPRRELWDEDIGLPPRRADGDR